MSRSVGNPFEELVCNELSCQSFDPNQVGDATYEAQRRGLAVSG